MMTFSYIPIQYILLIALVITAVYKWRYRHINILGNWWVTTGIFVVNVLFFGWAILLFILTEFIRSQSGNAD